MSANPHGAAIKKYVFHYGRSPDGTEQVSSFRAALREARTLTDRDPATGARKKRRRKPPTEWSGALMYLVLLEQVGKVLRPENRRASPRTRAGQNLPKEQDIARSLRYFGERWVSPRERGVFVALRNGFAHDFGLTNRGRGRVHKFALTVNDRDPLVRFPDKPWNGRFGDDNQGGLTYVNLHEFARCVERIVEVIEHGAKTGTLRLATGMTQAELDARFGFQVFNPDA